jgi:hypothetical protein
MAVGRDMEVTVLRRHWWWAVVAIVLFGLAGGGIAWDRHTLRAGRDTVSVLLVLGRNGTGQATISVRRGRVADPGPFARRVASLLTPTAQESPTNLYTDLLRRTQMIDVPLANLAAPLTLDTRALQESLAAGGFQRLVVGLYSGDHWQVTPQRVAQAGTCWGKGLSCEWRLATAGAPLQAEIRSS